MDLQAAKVLAITLPDGREFELTSTNIGHAEWVWRLADQVLVRFKGWEGLIKASGSVEVEEGTIRLPELALLVVLGWYLILLHAQDAVVASTAPITAARTVVVR